MLELQPIMFRGHLVAVANSRRFFLGDDLDTRPPGDPELSFVGLITETMPDASAATAS